MAITTCNNIEEPEQNYHLGMISNTLLEDLTILFSPKVPSNNICKSKLIVQEN